MTSQKELKFWKRYLLVYDHLNDVYPYKNLINTILKELNVHKGEKILDAGGGTGNIAIEITKFGGEVVLLDNFDEVLKEYKKKYANGKIVKHDLKYNLPFESSSFDKIVCNNTLYILEKKYHLSIIKEFNRVLKYNGLLILSNPIIGASPFKILFEHLRIIRKKNGLFLLIKGLLKEIRYLLLLLYYNNKIRRKSRKKYFFFTQGDHEDLLRRNNFKVIKTLKVYSDQNLLSIGLKR